MSDPRGDWAAVATEALKGLRDVGRAFAAPIGELVGMGTDHLRVIRFERQLKLLDRVKAVMHARGLERLDRRIPLNTLLPLLDHATLEEDDDLQGVWAEMLVNAGDVSSGAEMRRAYVSMLADLTAFDVGLLAKIFRAAPEGDHSVWTHKLPDVAARHNVGETSTATPREDVLVSLGNLSRIGTLMFLGALGGGHVPNLVYLTPLGRAFITACTRPGSQRASEDGAHP